MEFAYKCLPVLKHPTLHWDHTTSWERLLEEYN